jgi:hypothetical protein
MSLESNPTLPAVATCINDSFASIRPLQRQVGILGPNKSNCVGEQREIGQGSRPTAAKVLSVIGTGLIGPGLKLPMPRRKLVQGSRETAEEKLVSAVTSRRRKEPLLSR